MVEDIPLAPLPPWGLAQQPLGLARPGAPKRQTGGCSVGSFAGAAAAACVVVVNIGLIALACQTGKLGATFNGQAWSDAIQTSNSGYSGQPNQPKYVLSDQCLGFGLGLGFGGSLAAVIVGIAVSLGVDACMKRNANKAHPMDSLA